MSNPPVHAERSAKKWGGVADDYWEIQAWFDATKAHCADNRHRLLLHNSFGILLAEQVFGPAILNSAGRRVFARDLGAMHVMDDLGFIPTVAQCLAHTPCEPWMSGARKLIPRAAGPDAGLVDHSAFQGETDVA
jgi:hypothetical protein